jgi:hypothetical protein
MSHQCNKSDYYTSVVKADDDDDEYEMAIMKITARIKPSKTVIIEEVKTPVNSEYKGK